jgi:hypothetical protein
MKAIMKVENVDRTRLNTTMQMHISNTRKSKVCKFNTNKTETNAWDLIATFSLRNSYNKVTNAERKEEKEKEKKKRKPRHDTHQRNKTKKQSMKREKR